MKPLKDFDPSSLTFQLKESHQGYLCKACDAALGRSLKQTAKRRREEEQVEPEPEEQGEQAETEEVPDSQENALIVPPTAVAREVVKRAQGRGRPLKNDSNETRVRLAISAAKGVPVRIAGDIFSLSTSKRSLQPRQSPFQDDGGTRSRRASPLFEVRAGPEAQPVA